MTLVREVISHFIAPFRFAQGEGDPTVFEQFHVPDGVWPNVHLPGDARFIPDIEFAETPQRKLLLDLCLPGKASGPLPLIVWIHGGGWAGGGRREGAPYHLVAAGYALASITYRFSQEAIFPSQIHDCKGAIRFLRAHAAEYGIDPDRIGVWGGSAGGHLVSLLGTTGGDTELEGDTGGSLEYSSCVQAVCNYCGPTDLLWFDPPAKREEFAFTMQFLDALVGGPLGAHRKLAVFAHPITHVRGSEPPFFLMFGDVDNLIPTEQAEIFVNAMKKAGSNVCLEIVHGGHIFWGADNDRMVIDFFDRCLR